MKHLSREELIDSLEQTLPAAREAHMDSCATCRAERESLRRVLERVVAVDVPEPSPLFWEHFSAHVRDRVAHQPPPRPSAWPAWATLPVSRWSALRWPNWAVASATLMVCATLGWVGWNDYRYGRYAGALAPGGRATADYAYASRPESVLLPSDAPSEEDWNLVVSMAEDVTVDETEEAGLAVRPGAAERVMADLSSEQRRELARLLTAEMARPSS